MSDLLAVSRPALMKPNHLIGKSMPLLLRCAVLLGATPLLIGTSIFVLWQITHEPLLEAAGLLTILLGMLAFLSGMFVLLLHLRREWRSPDTPRGRLLLQAFLAGSLLLSNFPAAGYYASAAIDFHTRYTVLIQNDSREIIESFVVTGPGVQTELGPIPPGQRIERHFHFHGEGALMFTARQHEIVFNGEIDGYVSDGIRGARRIRIQSPTAFEIQPIALRSTVWEG